MDINWRSPNVVWTIKIILIVILLSHFIFNQFNWVMVLICGIVLYLQLKKNNPSETQPSTPSAYPPPQTPIQFDDTTQAFTTQSDAPSTQRHHKKLNHAILKIREAKQEKDSEYLFFKNIVQHVGIGLLAFHKDGTIVVMNTAACRILRTTKAKKINDLRDMSDELVNSLLQLKTGGRELIRYKSGGDIIPISLYVIELTLRNEEVKLVTMSNLQTEMEEKEMEAWQSLVRVLTHEIMNSVTPISSLSSFMETELETKLKENQFIFEPSDMEDFHLSLQTISRRSEGLIHFVKEFRSLSHAPKPQPTTVQVKTLLENTVQLHKQELADNQIAIDVSTTPEDLTIVADEALIEQVLINLLKNAMQAFDGCANKKISVIASTDEKGGSTILIKDNGVGIEPEALEKIFIPFFSTKKSGSGIGLSLSRQIMRQHQGRLLAKSTLGEGSEFLLKFE